LGITIDSRAGNHTLDTYKGRYKTIAIINKAKYVLNYNALYILYSSLILPYLTYGIELWGNNYKTPPYYSKNEQSELSIGYL